MSAQQRAAHHARIRAQNVVADVSVNLANRRLHTVPEPPPDVDGWKGRGECRGKDPRLFYPEQHTSQLLVDEAKKHCNVCPVQPECLEHALANHEFGIWGGTGDRERRAIRRARRQVAS